MMHQGAHWQVSRRGQKRPPSMVKRVFWLLAGGLIFSTLITGGLPWSHRNLSDWPMWLAWLMILLWLAWVITRMALRPLIRMSRAAEAFANDINAAPLPEHGPYEIRAASAAFNRMQAKIKANLAERTSVLAAIAHDLQTPLTRLRLRLEQVQDETLRQRLGDDLQECQNRVREGLDLARSLGEPMPLADVELHSLVQSACDEASDAGLPVEWMEHDKVSCVRVMAHAQSLLRCVENLIGNAVKYGARAHVSVWVQGDEAVVQVRDFGPGIAPQDLDRVFEPFVRLEQSRSRDTGGTGLGLYIVSTLMRRQHARVVLENLSPPQTGLRACLYVPLYRG